MGEGQTGNHSSLAFLLPASRAASLSWLELEFDFFFCQSTVDKQHQTFPHIIAIGVLI
jgi:hypothetical protein